MQTSIHITDVPKTIFKDKEYSLGSFFTTIIDSVEKLESMLLWNQITKDRTSKIFEIKTFKDSLKKKYYESNNQTLISKVYT